MKEKQNLKTKIWGTSEEETLYQEHKQNNKKLNRREKVTKYFPKRIQRKENREGRKKDMLKKKKDWDINEVKHKGNTYE